MKKTVKTVISIICVIAILVCGGYLVRFFYLGYRGEQSVQEAASSLITDKASEDEERKLKEEYRKKYPNVDFPDGLLLKYYPLYAKNQDLRGWISIPELKVDYPLVQGKNNDYYLHKNINKEYDYWGTPFFDYRNKFNPDSQNLTLFGHNSPVFKDKVFAKLNVYLTADGYKRAPVIKCDTIFEEAYWKVYAVFITNAKPKDDNGRCFNYMVSDFSSEEDFWTYLSEINERSIYSTGVDISEDDELLTISTCNYSFDGARMIIVCRKVRKGESADVNLSLVATNKSPKYPQAWYDEKGLNNPYK